MSSIVWGAVFALAVVVSAPAQAGAADPQTGASRVALASVTDPRNRPLVDVSADDFVIQEAGAPREILSVRPADYPIVVLLDTGIEARADFSLMQKAVEHFIDRIGQRPIALATFGNTPKLVTTFEDDRQTVLAWLAAIAADTAAGSLLLHGAALAGETISATGTLFSAIVILSATPADASRNAPAEMIAPVVDSNAILHVVANRPTQSAGGNLRSNPVLRDLAEQKR